MLNQFQSGASEKEQELRKSLRRIKKEKKRLEKKYKKIQKELATTKVTGNIELMGICLRF